MMKTPRTTFQEFGVELRSKITGVIREDESMENWTTFKCKGRARFIVSPTSEQELQTILRCCAAHQVEWRVLGRGSNLLVRDGGFLGVFIDLSDGFSKIEERLHTDENIFVNVGAGVPNGTLLKWAREKTLGGLGFAFGIPGSLGGSIRMNAGTPLGWFGKLTKEVRVMAKDGEVFTWKVSPNDFVYRDFPKARGVIILSALLSLALSNKERVESEIEEAKKRRSNQPLELPNFGSVFKNPEGEFAGKLVEAVGMKGERIGDAMISSKHANFIVNVGHAKTKDALELIARAQNKVMSQVKIHLEPEVHVMGEDE